MNTETPKARKSATKAPPSTEPANKKIANKKVSKKPAVAKPVEPVEPKKVVKAVESEVPAADKKKKNSKTKVVRDSFSFPEQDYVKISELKKTCLAAGVHVKKSEILRAGLHLLTKLSLNELKETVEQVEKVQTGRPNVAKT